MVWFSFVSYPSLRRPKNPPFLKSSALDGAFVPPIAEPERDDDKTNVQEQHEDSHAFGHLPVEGQDAEENWDQHEKEERDGAAHARRGDGHRAAVHNRVQ